MKRSRNQNPFLSDEDVSRINLKIAGAEGRTSAEIKVVIVPESKGDIRRKARQVFKKYGLYRTEQRNGVLIMLVPSRREFLIYGDKGIHDKAGQGLWNEARNRMSLLFSENRFCDGLCTGIHILGETLSQYFPPRKDDVNEIPNEVAFEDQ